MPAKKMPEDREMTKKEAEEARIKGENTAGGREDKGEIVARHDRDEETSFIFDGSKVSIRQREVGSQGFRPVRR